MANGCATTMTRALVLLVLASGAACSSDEKSAAREHLVFDLSLEIRYRATVDVEREGPNLEVAFVPEAGFDLLEVGHRYDGIGRIEEFPEAHARLYTAGLDAPAIPSGPCGARPISLALSLSRRGDDPALAGSLAAYCGQGVYTGTPVRIFRLAGKLRGG